ncbi:unnamed protein product [[Candida] boidinii]|nr:unnamed protein product [[Candida] boidinii]
MNKNETLFLPADINKLSVPSSSPDSVLYTVIKEFNARLGDEVNLNIGDIVELISDDSEYGDGWYMGKNLSTNNVGLYPKAFTQILSQNTNVKKQGLLRSRSRRLTPAGSPVTPTTNPTSYFPNVSADKDYSKTTSNNITPNLDNTDPLLSNSNSNSRSTSYNNNLNQQIMRQNSTVTVRNTLNDINKALDELNSNQTTASANTTGNDSSIVYNGASTPTKESFQSPDLPVLNPAEVESWTPSQVTQYFSYLNFDLDTAGQFARHKISGLILVQMELSHLKELDIASFGTRFELFKEIEELKTAAKEKKYEEKYGGLTPSASTNSKGFANVNKNTTPASDSSEYSNNKETKLYGIGITKAASQRRQNYTHTRQRSQSMDDVKEILPKRSSMAINSRDDDSEDDELELYESPRKAPHPPPSVSDASSTTNSSPAFQSNPNFRFGFGAQNSINNNNNNNSFSQQHQQQQQYSRMSMFEPHSRDVSIGASSSVYNDPHHSRTSSSLSYINSSNINNNNNNGIPTTSGANYSQRIDTNLSNKLPNNNFAATTTTLESTVSEDRLVKTIPKYSSLLSDDKETVYLGSPTEDKIPGKKLPKSPKKNASEDDEDEDDEHGDYQDASDELGVHTTPTQKEARFSSTLKKLGFSPKRRSISAKEYSSNNGKTMDPKRVSSSILPLTAALDASENDSANATASNRLSKNISRPLPAVPLATAKGAGGNDSTASIGTSSDNSNSSTPTSAHPSTIGLTTPTQSTVGRASSALRTLTTRRTKVQTSAYLEGIRDITPDEAIKTADYSGWMNKRGNMALGSWKNRFFTLHKTRLSYFTSTKDRREKGVIDITSHRVLAAVDSEDKISAAYAASTGSGNYCFKIVPPAPGSRKGLTFTQQKVHYFAVETRAEMRAWMAALMKATIELDESQPVISSCVTPTIPIKQAQEMMAKAREQARLNLENLKLNNFNEGENGNGAVLDNGSFSSDTTSPTNTFTNNNVSEKSTPLSQLAGQFPSPAQLSLNSNGSGSNRKSTSTNNRLNGLSISTHNTNNNNNLDSSTPTSATINGSPYQDVKDAFTDIPNGLSTPYLMTSGMALPNTKGPLEINDPVSNLSHSSSMHSVFVYHQTNPKAPDYNSNKSDNNNSANTNNGSNTVSLNTATSSTSPSTAGNNNNTSFATSVSSSASNHYKDYQQHLLILFL